MTYVSIEIISLKQSWVQKIASSIEPLSITRHQWPWWRHQMETFSAWLALYAGNSPVPVNSPHKGQWRGALMFSLICVWINGCVNNREAGDLRRNRGHYDVIVMLRKAANVIFVKLYSRTSKVPRNIFIVLMIFFIKDNHKSNKNRYNMHQLQCSNIDISPKLGIFPLRRSIEILSFTRSLQTHYHSES